MSFSSLGLIEPLLKAIKKSGYEAAFPIQTKAIPAVLAGKDVLAAAQTGTGKTAGFALPILQLLEAETSTKKPIIKALVLTPTRELAAQIDGSFRAYGEFLKLQTAVVFGGVNSKPQIKQLKNGIDILIATPGRLLDLQGQGFIDLSQIKILVLDEADRMLDMGFIHDIRKIMRLLPEKRQNLLFSATFSQEIREMSKNILHSPVKIEVAPPNSTAERIEQLVHPVDKPLKSKLLSHLIREKNWQQVLVFTRTKHGANQLTRKLERDGIKAVAIHGNKSQGARTKALAEFKQHKVRVLVATDIAARGLDIEQLPYVVNYDLSDVAEDYIHRIGRTGRAGSGGQAVSLVSEEEKKLLKQIEHLINQSIPKEIISGFVPDPNRIIEPVAKPLFTQKKDRFKPYQRSNGPQRTAGNSNSAQFRKRRTPTHRNTGTYS